MIKPLAQTSINFKIIIKRRKTGEMDEVNGNTNRVTYDKVSDDRT